MTINLTFYRQKFKDMSEWFSDTALKWCAAIAALVSCGTTAVMFFNNKIITYGDAESHLNIAKRVVSGLTPGLAQLGGIWLPLPHLLLVPFVWFDPLWRSGLAGSIVSGASFCVAALAIFKLVKLLTKSSKAAFLGFLVFLLNPNVLYMQSTPMTELTLIAFLTLSTYYFIRYLSEGKTYPLILAGFFALAASLSRYDGWFLVMLEGLCILIYRFPYKRFWKNIRERGLTLFAFLTEKGEGEAFLFSTIACVGILSWFVWDYLILGDALYFKNSVFSAQTQQREFLARGQLPAYHNLPIAFLYYMATTTGINGLLITAIGIITSYIFLRDKALPYRWLFYVLLLSPFIFNVITLFMGQSIIFIPSITPESYQWRLFNVRYGLLMAPALAVLFGYLFSKIKVFGKMLLIVLLLCDVAFYVVGYARVLSYEDGVVGLSHSSHPNAEIWLADHYDGGLVLIDDYARTMSVIGSGIPMQNIVYIGTGLYWDEALKAPQRRMRWVILQKGDAVWKAIYDVPRMQGILYTYFQKVYTSDDILIFKRIE